MPRVVYADLDFVPGHLAASGPYEGQLWGGLGLVIVDSGGKPWREGVYEDEHRDPHKLLAAGARSPKAIAKRMRQRAVDRMGSKQAE